MVTKISAFMFLLVMMPAMVAAQLLEFHSAKKLSPSVNSTGEESLPLLSPDGRQLFFTRALFAGNTGGKFSGMDVWYSEASADTWKNPSNVLPGGMNNEGHNVLIGMSHDGKKKYFLSTGADQKVHGIYAVSRSSNYSPRPEFVTVPGIENENFLGVYVSPDFEVMFFSMKAPDSRGQEDLYFSVKSAAGQWSAPKNMGSTINTNGYEISPFLSADKQRLYFSSNGHGGEGDADIFYSERLYNSWETWSLPVNLGKNVNSKKFDAYFSIYGDSIGYFSSNRDGRFADIFEVKVTRGRSVLKSGQRYLSANEWNRELGGPVSKAITFTSGNSKLNASQQELLFYIANKLQLQKNIFIHLVVREEENSTLSSSRLEAISAQLVQSGIGEERIITEQVDATAPSKQGRIEIRLIE